MPTSPGPSLPPSTRGGVGATDVVLVALIVAVAALMALAAAGAL